MNKLLFCNAYYYQYDQKQWATNQPYPPYGTIYAAAYMRENGYQVSLHDNNLVTSHLEIVPKLKRQQPDCLVIYDDGFNYLTKMCLTKMREATFETIKKAKANNCLVVISSSDSTDHYEQYLKEGADFVLMGEAEATLLELLNAIKNNNTDYTSIKGIAFIQADDIVKTIKRPVLNKLDELPDPAWDLVDIEPYRQIWQNSKNPFTLNIATTRGCPFKCNWCAKPIYGNRYNTRSPERVANEMEMLCKKFDVNYFWMCDDIFGLKPGWVQEFRDLVKEKGLNFKYKIQSRVDLLLKEDTIKALAESGLDEVWVGAESGSQRILDMMDKGTKKEQIYLATKMLKEQGVKVAFFLQFGYMDETWDEIQQTIQMVKDLIPDDIGISVSYPLPGTKFYDMVKEQMTNKFNWSDSDDLDMMYQGTYSSSFYKRLHRYVHKVFRTQQGINNLKLAFSTPAKVNVKQLSSILKTSYYYPFSLLDALKLKQLKNHN